ncbi:hypothetical protein ACFXG1_07825 [Streptomyces sp. NPDC059248]|uniref:hypothetical protein n=1 Tax=Streptomyces sp. NPDC059248 TaxID=3346791 RepID=UPI00367D04F7
MSPQSPSWWKRSRSPPDQPSVTSSAAMWWSGPTVAISCRATLPSPYTVSHQRYDGDSGPTTDSAARTADGDFPDPGRGTISGVVSIRFRRRSRSGRMGVSLP